MISKLTLCLSSAIILVASHVNASFIPVQDNDYGLAPLHMPIEGEAISDSYIVVLKDHVDSTQALGHCSWVSNMSITGKMQNDYFLDSETLMGIQHTYDSPTWRGYSGKFSPETLEHIRRSPDASISQ
ncbi:hypothetical protein LRAMOSA05619 [Lichtheimia ramosa]|uniref:Inhibitor I9 domain-containing protein n=1 Tax=Lichtheimia ramosa TaxID=688394 RepID=A0A077X2D7_9FUNG|nr:hypothetical protein LRAMOSA05619 [Lichtheimia ramosa]